MATLRADRLTKLRGEKRTVSDVSVEVADGELLVILGPSGCGKSTFLRMVAGLESISSGDLFIDGTRVNDVAAKDRDIAMVFQNYALYPHMTVADNMAFGLRMRGVPRGEIEARVREAAQTLELGELLQRKPKALSGGQQQRVALGRAIVRKPKLFLFDEPLSNLDARLRTVMRSELLLLRRRLNATILYVTHDQTEAMSLGDRLLVLKDGTIQQTGAPLEIYDAPANRFVAGFLGSPPMNFFDAVFEADPSGRATARLGEGPDVVLLPAAPPVEKGARVLLGVRPEDLTPSAGGDGPTLNVRVEVVEALGSETIAHGAVAGQRICARLGPTVSLRPGVEVVLRAQRAHVFDPTTARRWA